MDRKIIHLFTKEETASYETHLIPYNSEIVTNDNNDNDNDNNSMNNNSLHEQHEQHKSSSNSGNNNNNNNKIQVINSRTGKPLQKGQYLFVLTMDVDDEDPQQQQQQQKKKSTSTLLLFPNRDGKKKHTSPYPGAVPVWHAGEISIIRDTTNMHETYISEIEAASGHYLPTKKHIYWFKNWMKTSAYNTNSNSNSSSSSINTHHHQLKQQQQQQELNIESIKWIVNESYL